MTDPSPSSAQPPAPTVTGILVLLEVKSGVTRDQVMAVMPSEARATAQLYLEGKIREWYSRGDGRGAVFLLNSTDEADARATMDSLPLAKAHLVDEEYIPVGPLMPLRLLVADPS